MAVCDRVEIRFSITPALAYEDLGREEPKTHAWLQEWNTSGYVLEAIGCDCAEIE